MMMTPITIEEIQQQVKRSPKKTSPGEDGLRYQYLQQLYNIAELQPLIVEVYNKALNSETIPSSWQQIRIRLLHKKGDLTDLKNWRPISLINCDAKILSKILNQRLGQIANNIIQPSQTGFMRGRFIGENG